MSEEQAEAKQSAFWRICKKVYSRFKERAGIKIGRRAPAPLVLTDEYMRELGEALVENLNRNVLKAAENEQPRRRLTDEEILEVARRKAEESREMAQQLADDLNRNVLKDLKNRQTSKE